MRHLYSTSLLYLVAAISTVLVAQIRDTAIVCEDFELAVMNPLECSDLSGYGWTGAWRREIGDDVIISDRDLCPESVDCDGNHSLSAHQVRAGLRYERSMGTIRDQGQTVWMSVLMDFDAGSDAEGVITVALQRGSLQELSVGKKFGNQLIGLVWPEASNYNTDIPAEGLHWLVLRIDFSGDSEGEKVWLWVDPSPTATPSTDNADIAVPQAGMSDIKINAGINLVQIKAEGRAPQLADIDDIKIGASFQAVSPALVTSIQTVQRDILRSYPTPTSGMVYVEVPVSERIDGVALHSLGGELIYEWAMSDMSSADGRIEIFLPSHLPSGHYTMQIIAQSGQVYTTPIVYMAR